MLFSSLDFVASIPTMLMVDPLLLMFLRYYPREAISSSGEDLACTGNSSIDHIGTHKSIIFQHDFFR